MLWWNKRAARTACIPTICFGVNATEPDAALLRIDPACSGAFADKISLDSAMLAKTVMIILPA